MRKKITPTNKNFDKIINIGYTKFVGNRQIFSCFIGDCRFKSNTSVRFLCHLKNFHQNDKNIKSDLCSICECFKYENSLKEELEHMVEHMQGLEIKKIEEIFEKSLENEKFPELQILSVSSLSESEQENQNLYETILVDNILGKNFFVEKTIEEKTTKRVVRNLFVNKKQKVEFSKVPKIIFIEGRNEMEEENSNETILNDEIEISENSRKIENVEFSTNCFKYLATQNKTTNLPKLMSVTTENNHISNSLDETVFVNNDEAEQTVLVNNDFDDTIKIINYEPSEEIFKMPAPVTKIKPIKKVQLKETARKRTCTNSAVKTTKTEIIPLSKIKIEEESFDYGFCNDDTASTISNSLIIDTDFEFQNCSSSTLIMNSQEDKIGNFKSSNGLRIPKYSQEVKVTKLDEKLKDLKTNEGFKSLKAAEEFKYSKSSKNLELFKSSEEPKISESIENQKSTKSNQETLNVNKDLKISKSTVEFKVPKSLEEFKLSKLNEKVKKSKLTEKFENLKSQLSKQVENSKINDKTSKPIEEPNFHKTIESYKVSKSIDELKNFKSKDKDENLKSKTKDKSENFKSTEQNLFNSIEKLKIVKPLEVFKIPKLTEEMKNLKAREDLKINSKSNDEIRTSKSYEELKILKSDDEFKISKPIGKIRISKQNEDPKLSDELNLKRKRIIDEFSNFPPSKHRKFDYIGSKRSSWSGPIDNHLHRIPKTTGIVNNNKPSYAQKDFAFGNKHQHLRNFSETTKFDKHFNSNLPTNFSYKNQRKSNQIIPEIRKNYNENFSNHYKSFSAENHKNSTQNISVFKNSSSKACELKSMREFYPWLSENLSRAVFKTKNSIEILLSEFCLFSTYKCMRLTCSFFTTDFNDFKKHLTEHKNNNKHYCSFCLKGFKRDFELCNHIDVFHRFDRFQCSHCMYRSCQKSYVFLHQKKFHSGQNCEVLVSPIQKLLRSTLLDEKNGMRRNREIFVRAYCCKVPNCKEIFYNKGNFKKHLELKIAQPKFAEFGDIICQQLVEIDHRRNFKNVEGVTQCLFCNFGTDDDNIIEHMSLYHQSQFPFVCIRKMNPNYLDRILFNKETLETHTTIEFIGNHPGKLKDFNGDLKNLRSE